jgi:hypothetical protein
MKEEEDNPDLTGGDEALSNGDMDPPGVSRCTFVDSGFEQEGGQLFNHARQSITVYHPSCIFLGSFYYMMEGWVRSEFPGCQGLTHFCL